MYFLTIVDNTNVEKDKTETAKKIEKTDAADKKSDKKTVASSKAIITQLPFTKDNKTLEYKTYVSDLFMKSDRNIYKNSYNICRPQWLCLMGV